MGDQRVNFLVDNVLSLCQIGDSGSRERIADKCERSREVSNFLDDPRSVPCPHAACFRVSCTCERILITPTPLLHTPHTPHTRSSRCLCLKVTYANGNFEFTTQLGDAKENEGEKAEKTDVLFVKRGTEPLSPENISKNLDVHSLQGSPLAGLFNSLRGIWCPTLLQNSDVSEKLPPKVKQLLAELEATLSTVSGSNGSNDVEDVSEISHPSDEIAFWTRLKEDRRSPGMYIHIQHTIIDTIYTIIHHIHHIHTYTPYTPYTPYTSYTHIYSYDAYIHLSYTHSAQPRKGRCITIIDTNILHMHTNDAYIHTHTSLTPHIARTLAKAVDEALLDFAPFSDLETFQNLDISSVSQVCITIIDTIILHIPHIPHMPHMHTNDAYTSVSQLVEVSLDVLNNIWNASQVIHAYTHTHTYTNTYIHTHTHTHRGGRGHRMTGWSTPSAA
jgi:hypothetical protein